MSYHITINSDNSINVKNKHLLVIKIDGHVVAKYNPDYMIIKSVLINEENLAINKNIKYIQESSNGSDPTL